MNNLKVLGGWNQPESSPIQFNDLNIISAHDEQRWRDNFVKRISGKIGPSPTRDDGGNEVYTSDAAGQYVPWPWVPAAGKERNGVFFN